MSEYIEVILNLPLTQSFTYRKKPELEGVSLTGKRVEVSFGSRKLTGFVTADLAMLPAGLPVSEKEIKNCLRCIDSNPVFGQREIELSRWMSAFYLCSSGEALSAMIPSGRRETGEAGFSLGEEEFPEADLELSDEQQVAVTGLLDGTDSRPAYLYGLTGTGKTEVFLKAAEATLQAGRDVLYLVPEISLTHQVVEAVQRRFGNQAAILHSGLTPSRRLSEWMRIRRGEARVVVGARSAVFAPLPNPGLIIIDEEHDGSYKSGTTPRYHARQVALKRCTAGCTLVMGSATPSLEAWHLMQTGQIRRFNLTRRLSGGARPEIQVVRLGNTDGALTDTLKKEIRETHLRGRQTILFLNRRGFTHFFRCNTCGYSLTCRHCSVPLTFHKKKGMMKCHYCGWQTPPPSSCPQCNSLDVGYSGFGTEFIEDEVRRTFPECSVCRVDTDVLTGKDELKNALDTFRERKTDILLGTQMVAKGLNFPGVQLVGIALADTGLHMPDFRSAERTFALIVQVAGRAGRFFPDGKVIIQTWNPENPAIHYASLGDLEGFYERELEQRRLLSFPPFSRLIRLVFRSKSEAMAREGAAGAAQIIGPLLGADCELLGPSECPVGIISGNFRHHILLRGSTPGPLRNAVQKFLTEYRSSSALYIEVDVDPVHLM